jgi:23S rRNA pseudouridine2605 synthase
MAKNNFDKFITQKSNSAKKENFRTEKRSIKKEVAEGMAKTKSRKAAELAARKNTGPTGKGEGSRSEAPENYATKGIPAPEAPLIPRKAKPVKAGEQAVQMPLNKYIAHGGVSSRRDAATLVKDGLVRVNGKVVKDPGYKVTETDEVKVNDKKIIPSKNLVYILLNKPKDVITTSDDPEGRKTVLDLVRKATTERIFPVGRLDRNTTGVLLLTNDGELSQKLAHPAFQVKKIYEIHLDRDLTKKDFDSILSGIELEDGVISPDALAYADSKDKSIVGIEIHSGKNRIVRRIFEHLEYKVKTLDRVLYAGLTKKNVDRGRWRFLDEKEVRLLKYLNTSFTQKKGETKQDLTDPNAPYVDTQDFDIKPKGAAKPKRAKAGSQRAKTGTPKSRAHQSGAAQPGSPKSRTHQSGAAQPGSPKSRAHQSGADQSGTHRSGAGHSDTPRSSNTHRSGPSKASIPGYVPPKRIPQAGAPKHTPNVAAPKRAPKQGAPKHTSKAPKARPSHKKNTPHTNKKAK